jgi:hypothetical protein
MIRLVRLLTLNSMYHSSSGTTSLLASASRVQLPVLTALDLSSCKLSILPECICELTQLRKLNLANNLLRYLPYRMEAMTKLVELNLHKNPNMILPPPAIRKLGVAAIRQFLKGVKEGDEFKRLKLVLLGHGSVGKSYGHETRIPNNACTYIIVSHSRTTMLGCSSILTALSACEELNKRFTFGLPTPLHTSDIEASALRLSLQFDKSIGFTIWDFAGRLENYTTHQVW